MSALASAEPDRAAVQAEAVATQRLYERYAGAIFGFCLKRLGTREEAEDAVQTTFLNAQRGLRRGVVPQFEAAWLYKIAENVCNTRYDRARRRPETARDLDAMQDVLAAPERAEPDLIAALPDAIARMPATQRRALLLREWQGLSYREIAAELGLTEAAVETLLYRARRSLTANLERPERRGRLSSLNLGSIGACLKSLISGGGVKVVVAGVAVTATVASVGSSSPATGSARGAAGGAPVVRARSAPQLVPSIPAQRTARLSRRAHGSTTHAHKAPSPRAASVGAAAPALRGGEAPTAARSPAPRAPSPLHAVVPTSVPSGTSPVPVTKPSLPIPTPSLPVTTPGLPVTAPTLPVATPQLPAVTLAPAPVQLPPVPLPVPVP